MANGLLDPVYRILPSKVDAKRRSWDPTGQLGVDLVEAGHLTVHGRAVTLRRSLPTSVRGHLTLTGRTAVIRRSLPILPGHLQLQGANLSAIVQLQWLTIPRFDINWATVTYPHVVPGSVGIRANYLIGSAQTVTLGGIDVGQIVYEDGNDRIVILSNPGIDVVDSVYMVADGVASNTFQIALVNPISFPIYIAETRGAWNPDVFDSVPSLVLHPGDYYGQVGPLSDPTAVDQFQLGDNGYMKIDFHHFVTPSAAPSLVGSMRFGANNQNMTVNVSALPGIAAGQGLLMLWGATSGPLTTSPVSQGWIGAGTITQSGTNNPDIQVFWKYAVASEPVLNLTASGGGRQGGFITAWSGVHATNFVDTAMNFLASATLYQTPSITPLVDFCTIVSFDTDANNPPFNAYPVGYTAIDQWIIFNVGWRGAAYRKQTTRAATGLIDWNLSNVGGNKVGGTMALKGLQAVSEYRGFTVPMRHHTTTGPGEDGFGNTFWTMQILPPPG